MSRGHLSDLSEHCKKNRGEFLEKYYFPFNVLQKFSSHKHKNYYHINLILTNFTLIIFFIIEESDDVLFCSVRCCSTSVTAPIQFNPRFNKLSF